MNFEITVKDGQIQLGEEAQKVLAEARRLSLRMKKNEIQMELFRQALKDAMKENGIAKFENESLTATYTPEHTTTRFDTKAFKNDHPKTYAKYAKESQVKDSVRVTFAE